MRCCAWLTKSENHRRKKGIIDYIEGTGSERPFQRHGRGEKDWAKTGTPAVH
jgi:hypothetical protein